IDKPRQSYASADLKIRTRTKLTLMLITITSQLPGGNVNSAIDVSRSIDVVSSIAVSCPKCGGLGYFGQLPMQDQDLAVVPLSSIIPNQGTIPVSPYSAGDRFSCRVLDSTFHEISSFLFARGSR